MIFLNIFSIGSKHFQTVTVCHGFVFFYKNHLADSHNTNLIQWKIDTLKTQ
jgi:hypothetical protein